MFQSLNGTDYPPGPDRPPLYQKLAPDYWKPAIAGQKRNTLKRYKDADDGTPEAVSDA